jgi:hypothetical protein
MHELAGPNGNDLEIRTEQASTGGASTMHSFTLEVRVKWPFAVRTILEGTVSVCAESTGKHTDVTEDALRDM